MHYILAVNPGSTSTKLALYEDSTEVKRVSIEHSNSDLEHYPRIADQYELRFQAVLRFLAEIGFAVSRLSAVVGRGGLLPPVQSGAYLVNESMVNRLLKRPMLEHVSNLGAPIAYAIANPLGIPAYIYDSVAVDELQDIARISGLAEVERKSFSHALNMRAVAIGAARELGKKYDDLNFIVAHIGGGISVSVHSGGKMTDIISDDEGPFSAERSGRLPAKDLVNLCYQYDQHTVQKKIRGKGGLISYLGTNSALAVEEKIIQGDAHARLIYEAMAYQIAKSIGELATVVCGKVDRIILTGGIANSKMLTDWIKERVEFIAPTVVMAGENELQALALGALRVLMGEETAHVYDLG